MAETVQSQINMLDYWVDCRSRHDFKIFSKVTEYQSDVKSYTSRIKPGMTASASIIIDAKQNILLVPLSAVKTIDDSGYVEVLVNGRPERKTVVTGSSNDIMIEIVSGLKQSDQVVTQTITSNSAQNQSQPNNGFNPGIKSTLMHILGCLDTATGGEYFFANQDASLLSDDELADIRMQKIGFVFQSFNLLPRTTVLRNVALPLVYAGVSSANREEQSKKALFLAGFSESHFNHLSNQLSGGQMQRVAIARALVNNPFLILADEPTGNLDTKTGQIVLKTFQKLHSEQKRTIVLITHERYIAEHAQRVIQIIDGEIVKDERIARN